MIRRKKVVESIYFRSDQEQGWIRIKMKRIRDTGWRIEDLSCAKNIIKNFKYKMIIYNYICL